jgi:hypothetical protein
MLLQSTQAVRRSLESGYKSRYRGNGEAVVFPIASKPVTQKYAYSITIHANSIYV